MKAVTEEVIQEIKERIIENFQPNKIILFGSYASGIPNKESDIDLLLVKESVEPKHKRSIPILRLFRGWMLPIDILIYTPKEVEEFKDVEGSFIHKILSKGRILYG